MAPGWVTLHAATALANRAVAKGARPRVLAARKAPRKNVFSQAGANFHSSEEDLRRIIRGAGFTPKQRDTLYQTYFLN